MSVTIRRVGDGPREVQAYPGVWVVVDTGDTIEVSEHAAHGSPPTAGFESIDGTDLVSATGGLLAQVDQWAEVKKKKTHKPGQAELNNGD